MPCPIIGRIKPNTYVFTLFNVRVILYQEVLMRYSATKLRQNLYNILDMVIDKGTVVEIERKGHILKIVTEPPLSKWDRLEPHQIINGDPESVVSTDWSEHWSRGEDL